MIPPPHRATAASVRRSEAAPSPLSASPRVEGATGASNSSPPARPAPTDNPLALRRFKSPLQPRCIIAVPTTLELPRQAARPTMQRAPTMGFPPPLTRAQERRARRRLSALETMPPAAGAPSPLMPIPSAGAAAAAEQHAAARRPEGSPPPYEATAKALPHAASPQGSGPMPRL